MIAGAARLSALLAALFIGACSQLTASYQTPNANVLALQTAGRSKLAASDFTATPGQESALNDLTIRGHGFVSPNDGSFAQYIRAALIADLKRSDRYDPQSPIVVSGVLQKNTIDGLDFKLGQADIAIRFKVERDDRVLFDKIVEQHHEWQSAFIGAVAIPTAVENYGATVGLLIDKLFRDPEFREATK